MSDPNTPKQKSSVSPVLIILGILIVALLAASVFLGYEYYRNRKVITEQKEELTVVNDSIDVLNLEYENQIKILDTIYEEISILKEQNAILRSEADQYMAELESLRGQLVSAQRNRTPIDSPEYGRMMEDKSKLVAERDEYKKKFEELLASYNSLDASKKRVEEQLEGKDQEVKTLGNENAELTDKVNKASRVAAFSIDIRGVKVKKDGSRQDEPKAKKVEKLRIELYLQENSIARPGEREVHFVVTGPGEKIIGESDDKVFSYKGTQMYYSSSETVLYSNDKMRVVSEISSGGKLIPGEYEVEAFMDGEVLKVGTVTLK